jgi:hypothetical protein
MLVDLPNLGNKSSAAGAYLVVQKPKRLLPFALLIGGLLLAKSNPEASIWHWLLFSAPGVVWLIV